MESTAQIITKKNLSNFKTWLTSEEREDGTIQKYAHDLAAFSLWLDGRKVEKETVSGWKEHLLENGYKPVTYDR